MKVTGDERKVKRYPGCMQPVFRFAPSPNGRLHLGHAFSALLNGELARRAKGIFLLRIEDIDTVRCTAAFTAAIYEDLAWLGLRWEEPVRVQSCHWQDYARPLDDLRARGLLYPCFCSRREVESRSRQYDPDGAPLYPGTCKSLTHEMTAKRIQAGEPHSWRLDMKKALQRCPPLFYTRFHPGSFATQQVQAHPARWGDAILRRKDTPTSYHLSVVTDDALQGVTHIVRGRDLEAATCLHVLLQHLLALPSPLYHHHPLITTVEGEKLSKSKGSEPLAELRQRGVTPEALRQSLLERMET